MTAPTLPATLVANPLLDFTGLPRFGEIVPSHVALALEYLIAQARAALLHAGDVTTPATWADFYEPLEAANDRLFRAWGIVGHLHAVLDSPELRDAYNASLPAISAYSTDLGQDEALYAKYKALRASAEFAFLSGPRKKIVEDILRDQKLSGAELPPAQKGQFKDLSQALSKLAAKFSENVLDATNGFTLLIDDEKRLTGVPDDVKEAMRDAAEKDGKPGWKVTLKFPSYFPVMQYGEDRALRAQLYRENSTRASELGKPEWDNSPLIDQLIALKHEQSQLLGYRNYAEVSLATKMAESPAQVIAFLREMAQKAKPYAEKDMSELRAFAKLELGLDALEAWDVPFASEKLRQARYAFSDQEVKQYFPVPKVLDGLFRVIETLFNVRIKGDAAATWHGEVRFFRIESPSGQLVGQFYLDLYARETKRGGAWMDEARSRSRVGNKLETPVAYLTCNSAAPIAGKPALLTHDEVITLFHEFGHGLHCMLTAIDDMSVAGIHGVEWDAVELPSQFMENFCWEWETLSHMTAHAETGAALPRALYDKMIAAKNFQSGMQTVRQVEFALFDMLLHGAFDPKATTVQALLDQVRAEVAVLIPPAFNRFQHSFSHIFGGGYAAGYYSYKWAEVLSADAYAAFEEARQMGVSDQVTGQKFWSAILSQGGSRPALESFVDFRGREPSPDALLRHNGMMS
jgi:oligopeptidase A